MASKTAQRLGRRVRALREARGWDVADLAYHAGVSERGVYYVENGTKRDPTLPTIERLSEALGVQLADLLAETTDQQTPALDSLAAVARSLSRESVELLTAVASRMTTATPASSPRLRLVSEEPATFDTDDLRRKQAELLAHPALDEEAREALRSVFNEDLTEATENPVT